MNVSETLKMPFLSGLGKTPQGILQNQSLRGFFDFDSGFQTVSGLFLAHLVCLKSVK
jgi:hypothetical protein